MPASTPRPRWRWWLFCAAFEALCLTRSGSRLNRWAGKALTWSVLPSWLAREDELATAGEALAQPDPWDDAEVPHAR